MPKELPSDFDWVKERQNCSAAKVFESLSLLAKKNVETMQSVSEGTVRSPFQYVSHDGIFSVVSSTFGRSGGVRFLWYGGDEIVVEDQNSKAILTATLTLNDKGECRLLVNGQEMDQWQLLKRVLEPLFFPAARR